MDKPEKRRSPGPVKTRSTPRIDATEHLTHVRTVHFTLLALCFILLTTVLLNRDTEVKRATDQLKMVSNGLQQWNPTWLQSRLLQANAAASNESGAAPDPWFIEGSASRPAIVIEKPRSERTLWPLPDPLFELAQPRRWQLQTNAADLPWDIAPEIQGKPESLARFKAFWNALDATIAVHRIETVSDQATIVPIGQAVGKWKETGSHEIVPLTHVPIDRPECRIVPRLTYIPGPPDLLKAIRAHSKAPHFLHGYCRDSTHPVLWNVFIEVTVKDAETFNGQSSFLEAHRITASLGPYDRAFPDLARVTANYDDLGFEKLFVVLSAEAARAGDRIELFDAKLPGGAIALWGLPLLCLLQLYLLLQLEALGGNLHTPPAEGFVAWIGIYPSRSAHATTVASTSLLPFLAGLALRCMDAPPGKWGSDWRAWGLTVSLSISCLLAVLTWRAVRRVRDAAAS